MDYQSVVKYKGQKVKITLANSFWYRAKIISVKEYAVVFIEEDGREITVEPKAILMIEEMRDEKNN